MVAPDRIGHRDTISYMSVVLDGSSRKPICRLHLKLKDCDVTDKTDCPRQHEWLAMKVENLVEVFRPKIESL